MYLQYVVYPGVKSSRVVATCINLPQPLAVQGADAAVLQLGGTTALESVDLVELLSHKTWPLNPLINELINVYTS